MMTLVLLSNFERYVNPYPYYHYVLLVLVVYIHFSSECLLFVENRSIRRHKIV